MTSWLYYCKDSHTEPLQVIKIKIKYDPKRLTRIYARPNGSEELPEHRHFGVSNVVVLSGRKDPAGAFVFLEHANQCLLEQFASVDWT